VKLRAEQLSGKTIQRIQRKNRWILGRINGVVCKKHVTEGKNNLQGTKKWTETFKEIHTLLTAFFTVFVLPFYFSFIAVTNQFNFFNLSAIHWLFLTEIFTKICTAFKPVINKSFKNRWLNHRSHVFHKTFQE
jgi:hypothetical protein